MFTLADVFVERFGVNTSNLGVVPTPLLCLTKTFSVFSVRITYRYRDKCTPGMATGIVSL